MLTVTVAEPDQLSQDDLASAEALVRTAFGDSFRTHDWLHGVDGTHVLVTEAGQLLAHAAVVTRVLQHHGDASATGYVESVAVRNSQQGRGLGRVVMDRAEAIIQANHRLGALNAVQTAAPFYAARGWQPWTGPTQGRTPNGVINTYDPNDRVFLMPTSSSIGRFSESLPLICDWRVGDLW